MDLTTFAGLRVGVCDWEDALEGKWRSQMAGLDVVRVPAPPPDVWSRLRDQGFVCKPDRVSWYASSGSDDAEFRSRLSKNDRQNLRTAESVVTRAGVNFTVARKITAPLLDEFFRVYEPQVEGMRRGFNVARPQRDLVLEGAFCMLVARDPAGELVGATVCEESEIDSSLRIRFSTVLPEWRTRSLARVMYVRAAGIARDLGRPTVTCGTDFNLYGHIVEPGLYSFKARLGFTPVAPHHKVASDRSDEADLVLRLDDLAEPSLIVSYMDETETMALEILSSDPDRDIRPYRPGLSASPRLRVITPPPVV